MHEVLAEQLAEVAAEHGGNLYY
jgi:hypothetical protein